MNISLPAGYEMDTGGTIRYTGPRFEEEMRIGYREMAELNRQLAEEHLKITFEVWPKYNV